MSWVKAADPWKIAHFAVAFLVAACVTLAPIVALHWLFGVGKYGGEWIGSTSEGTRVGFLVYRGEIVGFSAGYWTDEDLIRELYGRPGELAPSLRARIADDRSFSARVDGGTLDGRFASKESATGTCTVDGRTVAWNAEWHSQGDFSD